MAWHPSTLAPHHAPQKSCGLKYAHLSQKRPAQMHLRDEFPKVEVS